MSTAAMHTIEMAAPIPKPVTIAVDDGINVSGLMLRPDRANACLVLAHGAGAGMNHPWMVASATNLAAAGIATLRFQFPYMETGRKRPDPPALCQATVRAAVAKAHHLWPSLPLFAGGKSFGGRMTSQAQAANPLPQVRGLVFFGFPLHPANRPSTARADHLFQVNIPMLFIQGTRDGLADLGLLEPLCKKFGNRATLTVIEHADHSFHVPVRSGRTDEELGMQITGTVETWLAQLSARDRPKAGR